MYEYLPFILGAALILLGAIMLIMPKQCTKEEKRNILEEVNKAKRSGVIMIGLGVFLMIVNIIL